MSERIELVIVGAGPAGVSAALWARSLGIDARLLDRDPRPGGQLHQILFHPPELPGVAEGHGPEIAATFARQLADARIRLERFDARSLEPGAADSPAGGAWSVHAADGRRLECRAVVVATGLRRRRLGVPGERELEGRGVSYSARRDRERFAGQPVLIIGGGDGAFENALLLAEAGCEVEIVARDRVRARAEFRERVRAEARIRVSEGARVVGFEGDDALRAVRVDEAGRTRTRSAHAVVIKIGMVPNTDWCRTLDRDRDGYVLADVRQRTSREGVWAVGDVAAPLRPSISAAIGSAATALASVRVTLRGC